MEGATVATLATALFINAMSCTEGIAEMKRVNRYFRNIKERSASDMLLKQISIFDGLTAVLKILTPRNQLVVSRRELPVPSGVFLISMKGKFHE
jgi:hypothetical protein